jgi:hypothetical protein
MPVNARVLISRSGFFAALIVAAFLVFLASCGGGGDNQNNIIPPVDPNTDPSRPSIFRLVPNSGTPGTLVVIEGINFGKDMGTSTVSYNGVLLTVQNGEDGKPLWSDTETTVQIPADAVTGLIIVSKSGKQSYAGKNAKFTVGAIGPGTEGDPIITSISPLSSQPGTVLTISGENFGTSRGSSLVRIGSVVCEINTRIDPGTGDLAEKWSPNNIEVVVPTKESFGELPLVLPVMVEVGGVQSNANFQFTVEDINPTLQPALLTSVAPLRGEVGQTIEIRGQNFGNQIGTSFVAFNGVRARVVSWSNTVVMINVPAGATSGPLQVNVNDTAYPIPGETPSAGLTYPINFDVIVAAHITGISPVNVQLGGKVTLHGRNFGAEPGSVNIEMAQGVAGRILGSNLFNGSDPNHVWTDDTVTFVLPNDIAVTANTDGTFKPGTVRLTTSDDRVAEEQTITVVNAFEGLVELEFEAAPKNMPVTLTAHVVGNANDYSFNWDFGDGGTAATKVVSHAFTKVAKMRPKVRVTHKATDKASLFVGPEISICEQNVPAIGSLRVTGVNSTEPPIQFSGTIVRSTTPNLGKRIAHVGDTITLSGYNFGPYETLGRGLVSIKRRSVDLSYNGNVIIDPDTGDFAWTTDEFTGRCTIVYTITEQGTSMTGDVKIVTADGVESDNTISLVVEPRIISVGPQPPTVNDLLTFTVYDTGFSETKIDGPADDAERVAFLIIEMGGGGFIVSPASVSLTSVSFDLGGWTPIDATGQPVAKTPGEWKFYLWSCVLADGKALDVVNSGIVSPDFDVTIS